MRVLRGAVPPPPPSGALRSALSRAGRGTVPRRTIALAIASVLVVVVALTFAVKVARADCTTAFDQPTCEAVVGVHGAVDQVDGDLRDSSDELRSRVSIVQADIHDVRTMVGWTLGVALVALVAPFIGGVLRGRSG